MSRRVAVLVLAIVLARGLAASADPISVNAYERLLGDARVDVHAARDLTGAPRSRALEAPIALLAAATEVRVGTAVYTSLPHQPIIALLRAGDDTSLDRAEQMLDATVAAVEDASRPAPIDPDASRQRLDAVLRSSDFRQVPDWQAALTQILRDILGGLFPNIRAPQLSARDLALVLGPIALVLVVVLFANVRRGLRARVAREAALADAAGVPRRSATDELHAAEESVRQGRLRDALRALFLAALLGLEESGGLRIDPALTDREILARAAGSPRAGDLAALVALYEPAWYGVREPTRDEVRRADELARRIGT